MNMILKSLLFVSIVMMTSSCVENNSKKKSEDLTINVASVSSTETSNQKEFSFISKPFRTSNLSFRVGGPVVDFEAYAGNYYKQGNVVAEIDSRDFHIRNDQAEAKYNYAKAEFERIEILYKKDNVSASIFEKANAEYIFAKTSYEAVANALSDTELIAPFNGYVGEVFIEKHQEVKPTQSIISLVDVDRLKIEFYVTQDVAFNSKNLKYVDIRFDAMPELSYRAEIAEMSKSATRNNLSFLFTAILPNPDNTILAGMSGKVYFNVKSSDIAPIATLQSALCHNPNDNNYVWVVDANSNTVSKRGVVIGDILSDGYVSIVSGLKENEVVATTGLRFLSDGTKIKIAKNNHTK